jgi:hypothetical protein
MSGGAFALGAGVVYTLLGVAGLFPAAFSDGRLFALFPSSLPLAVLHLAVGITGLAGATGEAHARRYSRALALALGVLGALGLVAGLRPSLGLFALAGHSAWLHLGTAAVAAYFGWRAEIPVLREELVSPERRRGVGDRRDTVTTVSRERRHGDYDRRMPLGT